MLLGARQTGKTTLIQNILAGQEGSLYFTADDPAVVEMFRDFALERIKRIFGATKLVCIDEAQRIPSIGVIAKLIHDNLPEIRLILTGSSSFELAEGTYESLTGRKRELLMHPISWKELANYSGDWNAEQQLEQRMRFGMYPEVITSPGEEQEVLREIVSSYLYKDLLNFSGIRKPRLLEDLLRALALQLGQEVSINELSNLLGVGKDTISTYIDLLEKAFILFRLPPLSRNLRNEIRSFNKIYFCDVGIRNAVLGNFLPLQSRTDKGALWENFIIAERRKFLSNNGHSPQVWFWRNSHQQEVDYIEEANGEFSAWEFKFNDKKPVKPVSSFQTAYSVKQIQKVSADNFWEFVQ